MPVLDARKLSKPKLQRLAKKYDALAIQSLKPLAQLDADPVRIEIDEAVGAALGLPSLKMIRQLLAREPGLTGTA